MKYETWWRLDGFNWRWHHLLQLFETVLRDHWQAICRRSCFGRFFLEHFNDFTLNCTTLGWNSFRAARVTFSMISHPTFPNAIFSLSRSFSFLAAFCFAINFFLHFSALFFLFLHMINELAIKAGEWASGITLTLVFPINWGGKANTTKRFGATAHQLNPEWFSVVFRTICVTRKNERKILMERNKRRGKKRKTIRGSADWVVGCFTRDWLRRTERAKRNVKV